MALTARLECGCGKFFFVYVPKRLLAGWLKLSEAEQAEAAREDEIEQQQDEVAVVRRLVSRSGATFIDGSKVERVICDCGASFGVRNLFVCPHCGERV